MIKFSKFQLEVFAHTADMTSKLSPAKRLQVGSVLVSGGRIKNTGFNSMPSDSIDQCCETPENTTKKEVIHAEISAMNDIIFKGNDKKDNVLFVTHSPCLPCATQIVKNLIKGVVYQCDYRDSSGIFFLLKNKIRVYKISENYGCEETPYLIYEVKISSEDDSLIFWCISSNEIVF